MIMFIVHWSLVAGVMSYLAERRCHLFPRGEAVAGCAKLPTSPKLASVLIRRCGVGAQWLDKLLQGVHKSAQHIVHEAPGLLHLFKCCTLTSLLHAHPAQGQVKQAVLQTSVMQTSDSKEQAGLKWHGQATGSQPAQRSASEVLDAEASASAWECCCHVRPHPEVPRGQLAPWAHF